MKRYTGLAHIQGQNIIAVAGPVAGYLDLIPKSGFNHIAFFSLMDAQEPIWLTSGEWEVTQIAGLDAHNGLV